MTLPGRLVCLDEAAKQLLGEVREPLPARPGCLERVDGGYTRQSTAALSTLPKSSKRSAMSSTRRPPRSCWCSASSTPTGIASLYAAFPPQEARRLAERLEIHHTPKHGSWLNMAEIELSVLARQCLDERMDNQAHLAAQVAAWQHVRNHAATKVDWRFTTSDARVKLKRLYPVILP